MKITTKLTLLFLVIALVPLILVSILFYTDNRRRIETLTLSRLNSINQLKADEFKRWVMGNECSLRALAQRPLVRQYATQMSRIDDEVDHQFMYVYTQLQEEHFAPVLGEAGGFIELFLLRPTDGRIMISSDASNEGKFREHEPFFVWGMQETFVQNSYYALDRGTPVMTISTPVISENGRLVAVLAGHADLSEMSNIMLKDIDANTSLETYLVNKFNFFITESRFVEGAQLTKTAHTDGTQACIQQNSGEGFYNNYRNVSVIGVYDWIPDSELCILTEIDQSEALAPIVKMRNTLIIISLAVAGVTSGLGTIFARTITNPIRQLVHGSKAIKEGDLDYRIHLNSRDEIGLLAETFNQMVAARQQVEGALRDQQNRLEQAVRDRTQSLQASEERFALAVAASNTGIWDWKTNTSTVYYSPRWKSIIGYADDEISHAFHEWEDRLHPDDKERMLTAVANFLQNPVGNFSYEFRMKHKDGSYRWILNRSAAQVDEQGKPLRMFGSHLDITELKESEAALAQKADELTRSNKELEQFAYIASHDLQEPLRMVTSYLQLLDKHYENELDEDANEFIGYAIDGANRMRALINDLLAYSRVGSRGQTLKPVDSQAIVDKVCEVMQLTMEACQAIVVYTNLPTVLADEGQLSQLFQNLLSNALKFRSSAPPRIHIAAEKYEDSWQFSIRDNGIGMNPQFSSRIFKIFQRLHTRDEYPGTGIGLAICQKIVSRHGGTIWVDSQLGQGATFFFTLQNITEH